MERLIEGMEAAGKVLGAITTLVVPIAGIAKWRAKKRKEAEAKRRNAERSRRRRERELLRRGLVAELRPYIRAEVEASKRHAARDELTEGRLSARPEGGKNERHHDQGGSRAAYP